MRNCCLSFNSSGTICDNVPSIMFSLRMYRIGHGKLAAKYLQKKSTEREKQVRYVVVGDLCKHLLWIEK